MLDGWGRTKDLPDKSDGEVRDELSRKWEAEGPLADGGGAPAVPAWLAGTQHGPGAYSHVSSRVGEPVDSGPMPTYGDMEDARLASLTPDEREEEGRLRWLAYYMEQKEWDEARGRPPSHACARVLTRLRGSSSPRHASRPVRLCQAAKLVVTAQERAELDASRDAA
eukprot:560447-Prymnesium_polylepis.2